MQTIDQSLTSEMDLEQSKLQSSTKTTLTVSAVAALAACGGGSDADSNSGLGGSSSSVSSGSGSSSGVVATPPTAVEASRFLGQAAFGGNDTSISEVVSKGYSAWITDQIGCPAVKRTKSG